MTLQAMADTEDMSGSKWNKYEAVKM